MNNVWQITAEIYCEICELAMSHGKKPGESMQEEFEEVYKKHNKDIKHLGTTEKDIDQLTGDLREEGKRVLNINEIERRRKNQYE